MYINFSVQWLGTDGQWNTTERNSGNYPVGMDRTTPPLSDIGVPSDALVVTPYGHTILGRSGQGTPFVGFETNGQIASYEAVGITIYRLFNQFDSVVRSGCA